MCAPGTQCTSEQLCPTGYAGSSEQASRAGVEAAADAAFYDLSTVRGRTEIILCSFSLGSYSLMHTAAKCAELGLPLAGAIMESPLLSIGRVCASHACG